MNKVNLEKPDCKQIVCISKSNLYLSKLSDNVEPIFFSNNLLTSLEFCPKEINGDFNCSYNKITSLKYCLENVGSFFNCSNNELTDLEFCPNIINASFDCSNN